jgi:hypothetical protein
VLPLTKINQQLLQIDTFGESLDVKSKTELPLQAIEFFLEVVDRVLIFRR